MGSPPGRLVSNQPVADSGVAGFFAAHEGLWEPGENMKIEGSQTYLITGGGGAIAGSIARVFHEAGARLVLVDRDRESIERRAAELGAVPLQADLTRYESVAAMVEDAMSASGTIDGVIHTTGGFAMAPAVESGPELYERMLDLNLRSLVYTARALLPHFVDNGSGFLAAFSAAPAWDGAGGGSMSLYAAAKAAVAAYLKAVDDELGTSGIGTAVVYPMGVVDTAANRRSMPDEDPSQWIDPDEIARALLFAATRGSRGRVQEIPITAAPPAAE
jgi:NADP-dependent 3-hydroxy acid dehydrogenase YdfG